MNQNSQMLKGVLEGCILQILAEGESYGYEITERLNRSGFPSVNEGTIYPLLMRLDKKGFLNAEVRKSPLGPKRKYYSLSDDGLKTLESFKEEWLHLNVAVTQILDGGIYG